jgi:PKD repeat protein
LASHTDPHARRIIAYGLRNPFRITARPGTSEIWVGDVGWGIWEEINRIVNPTTVVENFGWPCYEGAERQSGYEGAGLNICANLYNELNAVTLPFDAYDHSEKVVPGETCPTGSSSISGLAFYNGGSYPATYNGALFFADYSRDCIWAMFNVPSSPGSATDLVAAYGFEEGSGTAVADASGHGHTGAIAGATRTTSGRYGSALSFDGVNDWVTIAATNLLNLSSGATLMAWVYPTTTSGVRDVLLKEGPGVDIYNLYARNWRGLPESNMYVNGTNQVAEGAALPTNVWTHVAGTYNGSVLRLYLNGVEVAQQPVTGPIASSTGPVRIGGNSFWGEYFQGRIDEVRIYSRALTTSELQAAMNTPVPVATPPVTKSTFVAGAAGPVDLKIGPGGDLFYADLDGGTIRRIRFGTNQLPTAVAQATPLSGPSPLTVTFDGTGSSDPDPGDTIVSYAWDLDGDGQFDDSTAVQPTFTYTVGGSYTTRLRVTDSRGASGISAPVVITVGTPPVAIIDTPLATIRWQVDDDIAFSGQGTDQDDGTLPAEALTWELILHHCPSNCHTHSLQDFIGVASGSFPAPDHEYPSHLELRLTVTDTSGLQDTASVLLEPETVDLSFQSDPAGLQLAFNSGNATTPFDRTVIIGSNNSLSASSPQTLGGTSYEFDSWSDGGAQSHNITANASVTYTATYIEIEELSLVAAYGFNENSGSTVVDASGNNHTGTISGATRIASGRHGRALSFDGVNDRVNIADSSLLDLTTGMTVSAWVFPTVHGAGVWRNILIKERPGGEVYNLYTNVDTNVPTVYVVRNAAPGTPIEARGTAQLPLNTWTHLAATYDGAMLRLFVNGTQVRSQAVSGALVTSTGALRIGGNSIWGEYFQGRIDEVRIYSRALTASELQADMNTPLP